MNKITEFYSKINAIFTYLVNSASPLINPVAKDLKFIEKLLLIVIRICCVLITIASITICICVIFNLSGLLTDGSFSFIFLMGLLILCCKFFEIFIFSNLMNDKISNALSRARVIERKISLGIASILLGFFTACLNFSFLSCFLSEKYNFLRNNANEAVLSILKTLAISYRDGIFAYVVISITLLLSIFLILKKKYIPALIIIGFLIGAVRYTLELSELTSSLPYL